MEDQKRKIYSIIVNSYIRSDDCLKKGIFNSKVAWRTIQNA